eukprot:349759-Chlamydomonas_euryale.AAC.10
MARRTYLCSATQLAPVRGPGRSSIPPVLFLPCSLGRAIAYHALLAAAAAAAGTQGAPAGKAFATATAAPSKAADDRLVQQPT